MTFDNVSISQAGFNLERYRFWIKLVQLDRLRLCLRDCEWSRKRWRSQFDSKWIIWRLKVFRRRPRDNHDGHLDVDSNIDWTLFDEHGKFADDHYFRS